MTTNDHEAATLATVDEISEQIAQAAAETTREILTAARKNPAAGEQIEAVLADEDGEPLPNPAAYNVLYALYRHLDCIVPVDPADPDDCANVADVSVRALIAAGLLQPQPRPYVECLRPVDGEACVPPLDHDGWCSATRRPATSPTGDPTDAG